MKNEILPPLLPGLEPATFSSRVPRSVPLTDDTRLGTPIFRGTVAFLPLLNSVFNKEGNHLF